MNGYELSRQWFDFAFEKKECKVQHTALYLWIIELNNRLGWKSEFGLPSNDTMEGLSMSNKNVYLKTLSDIQEWGFIKIVKPSKNQYQSCIISICHIKYDTAQYTALDTALIRQDTQHRYDTVHGIDTIDKPLNNETKKPINKGAFFDFGISAPFESKEFLEAWLKWEQYRKEARKKLTKSTIQAQFKKLSGMGEPIAISVIENAIEKGWQGLYESDETRQQIPGAQEAKVYPLDSSDPVPRKVFL